MSSQLPNVSVSDMLTGIVLLVSIFNAYQNQRVKLEIANLKVWILRNFQTKPDSIVKEFREDA